MAQLFDFFAETLIAMFLPLIHFYHIMADDCILNVAAEDATGLEKWSNELLIPYHFVFCGRKASLDEQGHWHFEPRFPVDNAFWVKMGASLTALPASLVLGGTAKGLSFLSSDVRNRSHSMQNSYHPASVVSMREKYLEMGIPLGDPEKAEFFLPMGHLKKEGDTSLNEEKKPFQEIVNCLNAAGITWWVDCGTLLGAYRYGGAIPWDYDIDIAFLLPDFDNVLCALSALNPDDFIVQDWSGRDHPKSYIKVYNRKTNFGIDLYHFAIDPQKREIRYVLSLEDNYFMFEWWRIRERRFKVPTSFDTVFPLKKGMFEGMEVFLPQDPETYLQLRYGENLAPAKVYNPLTGNYEKDLSHPYWERSYAH